jgi:acetyl-CoA carboxylase biotin carboxylase subunit
VFRRLLVANRGEIALRIVRACRRLGIESVVAHSEADHGAPWLRHADRSVCVGPASSSGSYLNLEAILQAAEQNDCQAIHPGYGFLSENAVFAACCSQQGITFVGPGADAIRRMGDKAEAKRTMARVGLPTIPGSDGLLSGVEEARRLAAEVGYPVLLKATAGGGGRGMRICADESRLRAAFEEAALEAEKSFGNPGLYLEKFVTGGRHIEFQILCDAFGNAVHLGERECSVQRKHQKLIEEAPSPVVDSDTRTEFGARVASAAAEFGYRNAGTVEFLRAPDGALYFMEMNTRLQVEHPVTEMITGVDIVAEQLRIAAMHRLSLRQEQVEFRGHAIEFRINAEDPDHGFRPDPGTVSEFRAPGEVDGVEVRWDSAIESGYRIPPHYDSMVGKLLVRGRDRDATLRGARDVLRSLGIEGIRTTVPLHLKVLDHPSFASGEYDVDFLARSGILEG